MLTTAQLKAHISGGPKLTPKWAEGVATRLSKIEKQDIHVYMHRGYVDMTAGPDLEHPKLKASFIVPFKQKGKK